MVQSRSGKPTRASERVRKLWKNESMIAAIKKVEEGLGIREASVETLRRRVVGAVGVDCKPGPPTVLTAEEEQKFVDYE